ncbi:hypothetical protein GGD83_003569 [Rhodoblastus sphagnicola]|nr:hypothetical protein [Rhodoblastus sphagnicola]
MGLHAKRTPARVKATDWSARVERGVADAARNTISGTQALKHALSIA